jgi:uncharacterized protein (DUF1501 family)
MPNSTGCSDLRRHWNRRDILTAGSALGMVKFLPDILRAQQQAPSSRSTTFGRARSLILIYLHGGHAQQETWDPKPTGPEAVRGEFGAISTSVPGTFISELLPRSARLMHKMAVVRSMSHRNANHVQASLPAMTGHVHPPSVQSRGDFPPTPNDFPPIGAVVNSLRPAGSLPTWVQVGPTMRRNNGTILHGQVPGFLGASNSPLTIDQDLTPNDVRISAVSANEEVPLLRLQARANLLEQVDSQRQHLSQAAEVRSFDDFHQRGVQLLTSPATAAAFDLASEPARVRDGYGRTQFGQCCLLARRLAEAGVPIINVHFCHTPRGSWDTHGNHFRQMRDVLCPTFDQALSALITDLDQRGLLETTLVLPTAEFGRTPTINRNAGRDHWPFVYSIPLAGAGVAPGIIHGASDSRAAYPTENPHDPSDLVATVYHLLGVPPETTLYDQTQRPHHLIIGQKIDAVLQ